MHKALEIHCVTATTLSCLSSVVVFSAVDEVLLEKVVKVVIKVVEVVESKHADVLQEAIMLSSNYANYIVAFTSNLSMSSKTHPKILVLLM